MPLQKKSFLTLLISLIAAVAILFGTASVILIQSYSRLEAFTAKQNVERVENTYSAVIDQLKSTITDWSYWDDTYQFISDHNQVYIDKNLSDDTLAYLHLNFIQYIDGNGGVVYTKVVDYDGKGVTFSKTENTDLYQKYPLLFQSTEEDTQPSGIIYIGESPMLTVSSPVLHNDQLGPSNGTVLMGRFLNQNLMDDLADQLNTRIIFYPYPIDTSNARIVKLSGMLEKGVLFPSQVVDKSVFAGYKLLRDMNGDPAAVLEVRFPRDIYNQEISTLNYLFSTLLVLVLIVLLVFYFLLDRMFFKRIMGLSHDVTRINELRQPNARISTNSGNDEITGLGENFNQLLGTLEEVQGSYKMLVQNQGEGVTIVDEHEKILYANPAADGIFGVPEGELAGRNLQEFLSDEEKERIKNETQIRKKGQKSSYELNILRQDGAEVPILVTATPKNDSNGKYSATYSILRDISELKKARSILQESESKFRSFIEQSLVGIFLLNEDGLVTEWNQSLEGMTGLIKEVVMNVSFNEVLEKLLSIENRSEKFNRMIKVMYSRMIRGNDTPQKYPPLEIQLKKTTGEIIVTDMLPFPITTEKGVMIGGIFYDKTERRMLERAEKDQRTYIEALLDTSEVLNSTLNLDNLMDRILENTDRVLPSDTGAILLLEKGYLKVVRSRGYIEKGLNDITLNPPFLLSERPNMNRMFETGQPIAISDTTISQGWNPLPQNHWVKSYIGVPLKVHGRVIGFISLFSGTVNFYSINDAERLKPFANQAAISFENARLYSETQLKADTDELTGLKNRRSFFEMGSREIERAIRFKHPLAALMIDLDNFKDVNDNFGHPVGDRLLKELADVFKGKLRNVDLIARYGGDEFIVLLPENDIKAATDVAERICHSIAKIRIETTQGKAKVTASIGVAILDKGMTTLSALVEHADRALYNAKKFGKNRIVSNHNN
jgi:diguanylate cyclase (GGDEF)-like protein/PAS domain S-box-containing protein